jgi:hypothetical protein
MATAVFRDQNIVEVQIDLRLVTGRRYATHSQDSPKWDRWQKAVLTSGEWAIA